MTLDSTTPGTEVPEVAYRKPVLHRLQVTGMTCGGCGRGVCKLQQRTNAVFSAIAHRLDSLTDSHNVRITQAMLFAPGRNQGIRIVRTCADS